MSDSRGEVLWSLLRHMLWADERVRSSLRRSPSDDRAMELYAHVLGTERVWLARIEGTDPGPVWPPAGGPDDSRLDELSVEIESGYISMLQSVTASDLNRSIGYVNSAGDSFESRLIDILIHVFLHGAYHRGQIALLVRDGGGEPSPTDFIAFVRGAPAATRADRPGDGRLPRG